MSDDFQSHEQVTATKLNRALRPGRIIGRARRVTNSGTTTSTTRVPVLRLDDVPITSGRIYKIYSSGLTADGPTANDVMACDLVYTTDGSTPTIASPQLPGGQCEIQQPNATPFATGQIQTTYTAPSDQTLSLLLCIRHTGGTGAMALNATGAGTIVEFVVEDGGEDPGDTGVDL